MANITGTTGNDLRVGTNDDDTITGLGGDDLLEGLDGDDNINAGSGNDALWGGEGDDILNGVGGNDGLVGSAGEDEISGAGGNDFISGGEDDDTLSGGGGNDFISGGSGVDTITGTNGNDIIAGGSGIDTVTGGAGADSFQFNFPNEGVDTVTDFVPDDDTILVSAAGFGGGLTPGVAINANQLFSGAGANAANTNDQRFIYNTTSGALRFDADGLAATFAPVVIATLTGAPAITAPDIVGI
jgi:Ca2+-binding RTX toxin-like protein